MAKKLWGGRFKKETDKDFFSFQKSIHYDYRLAEFDLYHSRIHVEALKIAGFLTAAEAKKLDAALAQILKDVKSGKFKFDPASEDIHTDIHNKVEKKAGNLAHKLHTLRSRNDQIAFDEKWYCLKSADEILKLLFKVSASLSSLSKKYGKSIIPGYTHTQRAQKISFKDYVGAFMKTLARTESKLEAFKKNSVLQLGAGALAGNTLLESGAYTKAIKAFLKKDKKAFKGIAIKASENTLDQVSNRDFVIELLSLLSILQMHLSRLAEDLILYSTSEFHFIELPEEFCTGSSLMPHKKNPDFLELVRGYTGQVNGNLVSLLTTMKGLPLTYNRDMQLDKEPLFSSVEIVKSELALLAKMLLGIKLNAWAIHNSLSDESLYAVPLAEYLVKNGVPFKDAHTIIGKLIGHKLDKNIAIRSMSDRELKKFHPKLNKVTVNKIIKI